MSSVGNGNRTKRIHDKNWHHHWKHRPGRKGEAVARWVYEIAQKAKRRLKKRTLAYLEAVHIGGTLTRRFSALGHEVFVANSQGPESLS